MEKLLAELYRQNDERIAEIVRGVVQQEFERYGIYSRSGAWLNLRDAAEYAGVSQAVLRLAAQRGEIRYRTAGSGTERETRLFHTRDLDAWGVVDARPDNASEAIEARIAALPVARRIQRREQVK